MQENFIAFLFRIFNISKIFLFAEKSTKFIDTQKIIWYNLLRIFNSIKYLLC